MFNASHATRGILTGILTAALAITVAPSGDAGHVDVVVRGTDMAAAAAAVASVGGVVETEIGLIDAVAASVAQASLPALERDARTLSVTPDESVTMMNHVNTVGTGYEPREAMRQVGGQHLLSSGWTGQNIDIAIIDTGINREDGMGSGIVDQPVDLSLGGTARDGFGHGTVMGSIAAARWSDGFAGVARRADMVDVKVGDGDGVVDISQVLAAIDWTVSHRNTDGWNIRVLNLSFGTDGTSDAATSPLAYAVEAAWRHGIVVVAAAGNHGDALGRLASPAIDPYIIAVGALDTLGTNHRSDDVVPTWSAVGDGVRNPDIVAPGRSIIGRIPSGSLIAQQNPGSVTGEFIVGSGTSHASAFVAGVVADMLHANPNLTPDEVKAMLVATARPVADTPANRQGAGAIDLSALFPDGGDLVSPSSVITGSATQSHGYSDGTGSLDADRGSFLLQDDAGAMLTGDNTVVGAFDRQAWRNAAWNGSTWSGSTWSGSTWSGSTWSGSTWSGSTWSGSTWSGSTWSSSTWSSAIWGD